MPVYEHRRPQLLSDVIYAFLDAVSLSQVDNDEKSGRHGGCKQSLIDSDLLQRCVFGRGRDHSGQKQRIIEVQQWRDVEDTDPRKRESSLEVEAFVFVDVACEKV